MWAGKALFGDGKRQVRTPIARAGNAVLAASVNANAAAISQPRPGRGERQSGSGPLPHSGLAQASFGMTERRSGACARFRPPLPAFACFRAHEKQGGEE